MPVSPDGAAPLALAIEAFARALADPHRSLPKLLAAAHAFGAACAADARPPESCVRTAKEMTARAFSPSDSRRRSSERARTEQATITATIHGYYGRGSA